MTHSYFWAEYLVTISRSAMPVESGRWICKHSSGGTSCSGFPLVRKCHECNFIKVIECLGGPYHNLWWQCQMPWLYQGFSPQLHLQSGAGSTPIPVSTCQGLVTQLVDSIGISSREPRLIFTAGAMGVGKSHVIRWMKEKDILPLHDFAAGLHKPITFCQKPSRMFCLFPAQPRRRQCDDLFFSSAAKSRSSGLHQS